MLTDIEIAQQCRMRPITEIAATAGIDEEYLEQYGRYKAKIDHRLLEDRADRPDGKLILVTAINPTPAGEGKTTTSVGLADGLRKLGKNVVAALREPSLGPVFGVKGGAAGGGYAQVVPMEDINLHFTGDFHAIGAANNLLAAMLDNHIQQGNALGIDVKQITWKRCVDMNDRQLRHIIDGIGGKMQGVPREDGFDITVASEVMAVLCLATDMEDLRARIDRIVVGTRPDGTAFTVKELGATGSLLALLKEAMKPNLVQTIEGNLAFVHGGPFANIAHGCNSVVATKTAMKLGEYTVTEAGFGSDLGAEKFYNIKCRAAGLNPAAVVLVTSTKALKWHGGVPLADIGKPNLEAMVKGFSNLDRHIDNLKAFGPNIVVSINHFHTDTDEEINALVAHCREMGVRVAVSDGFAKGGAGAEELARQVVDAAAEMKPLKFSYEPEMTVLEKVEALASQIYRAGKVDFSPAAMKDYKRLVELGFDKLPVCVAKTPFSLSHDPALLGSPEGFTLPVQRLILNAGAGFVVVTTGAIMRMPGLPKQPAAMSIDVVDGKITGLA